MQKTKTKIITVLFLAAMTLALFPIVNASTGFISVLTTPATVPAGGNISLGLSAVTWSGGQFYLLLSTDGFSQVSPGDMRFTPSFNVNDLTAATTIIVTDPTGTYPGSWTIGNNQIAGTIPTYVAGGAYYIKAFDGLVTSLAVTSPSFTITPAIAVIPATGASGTSIKIQGNAFGANSLVNLSYVDLNTAATIMFANLTGADAIGNFTYMMPAPDMLGLNVAGDNNPIVSQIVTFSAIENKTGSTAVTANYLENARGLLQFGRPNTAAVLGSVNNATGLFGNLTDFSTAALGVTTPVSVGVGDTLRIAGNWFYPGNLTVKLDNTVDITPTDLAANGTGFFNTTVTVPTTGRGAHTVVIRGSNNVAFVVTIDVVQSITISPTSGPIGATVTVNGYGFPASVTGTSYNATITFDATALGSALTDANGAFTTTIVVPTASGGAHAITATTNDTVTTSASKTFTITASFSVTPSSFYANSTSTLVTAFGTGFDPAVSFFVTIDNVFSPFTNTTNGIVANAAGNLTFSFVGVGFQAGMHIVTVYQAGLGTGTNAPVANATFTVLTASNDILAAMNQTLNDIKATIITINGNTATLSTSLGTITTSVNSLQASISSISNGLATVTTNLGTVTTSLSSIDPVIGLVAGDTTQIKTTLGTITTSLSSIGTTVTKIDGNVATIMTDIGTLTGTVTSVNNGIATIQTTLGTMTADISGLKTDVGTVQSDVTSAKSASESLSPLIIVAIVLALVAAIAAIASIVLMRRKIAG